MLGYQELLSIQNADIIGEPLLVLQQCNLGRSIRCLGSVSEKLLLLLGADKSHQPVFNFPGGLQHLVLIGDQKLLKACVLNTNIVLDSAIVENVPAEGKGCEKPYQAVATEDPVTIAHRKPDGPADCKMRVKVGLGDPDERPR